MIVCCLVGESVLYWVSLLIVLLLYVLIRFDLVLEKDRRLYVVFLYIIVKYYCMITLLYILLCRCRHTTMVLIVDAFRGGNPAAMQPHIFSQHEISQQGLRTDKTGWTG